LSLYNLSIIPYYTSQIILLSTPRTEPFARLYEFFYSNAPPPLAVIANKVVYDLGVHLIVLVLISLPSCPFG
jgi:hypothetical protein